MAHHTLRRRAIHEDVVKRSRFVAVVAPLASPEDAAALVAEVQSTQPDAGHVCWALVWGAQRRWSDDGEPGGTAGRPMLEVLDKRGLDRAVAVVARRFGGVKLGAGGLARAYSGAVARAVDAAGTAFVPDLDAFAVTAPFADADALLRALAGRPEVTMDAPGYGPAGIELTGTVLRDAAPDVEALVADVTRGGGRWRSVAADDEQAADAAPSLDP